MAAEGSVKIDRLSFFIEEEKNPWGIITEKDVIKSFIFQNKIEAVYHFTAKNNLNSIEKEGAILSRKLCEERGIEYEGGGDALSKQLDEDKNLEDYVHCSFCRDYPMRRRLDREGVKTVVLRIDPIILLEDGVLFSNLNAAANNAEIDEGRRGLWRIDYITTQNKSINYKLYQAEILIPHCIPTSFIMDYQE